MSVSKGSCPCRIAILCSQKDADYNKAVTQKHLGSTEGFILLLYGARCHTAPLTQRNVTAATAVPKMRAPSAGVEPAAETPAFSDQPAQRKRYLSDSDLSYAEC